jgi:hypothetical protein
LWLALAGKVPGLITMGNNGIRFARSSRLAGNSSSGVALTTRDSEVFETSINESTRSVSTEPLVLINNMPAIGNAGDVLQRIDASTVERVEISSGINVLYGSQGANGVISIYTKEGVTNIPGNSKRSKPLQVISIQGYSSPKEYFFPNYDTDTQYEGADYRSTLYWNPDVRTEYETGEVTISFFAADLETQYRVVVEGVTEFNEPIRQEYIVTVSKG